MKTQTADIGYDSHPARVTTCDAVEAIGMTVIRSRTRLLNAINLALEPGDCVAVTGANGAGKSTLLKCLAGSVKPDYGQIRWFGNSSARPPEVRRQIGFVSHECGLYSELTAAENLIFAGRMYGISHPHEQARRMLASAGLAAIWDRPVRQLSQGVRQRLAIGRAVLHEPRLILLDEPFASVDAQGRRWLEQLFEQWRRTGRSVCFASHDVRQNHNLADRIVSLDHGRITAVESTSLCPATSLLSA